MYRKIIPVLKRDLPIEDYQSRRSNYFTKKGLESIIQKSELDELVELFFKTIRIEKDKNFEGLDNLEEKIIKEFLDESTEAEKRDCFKIFCKAEQILKHFIYVMDSTKLKMLKGKEKTLLPCLEMLAIVPQEAFYFRNPYKERPSDYPYLEQIGRVIEWRNEISHEAPEPTRKKLAELEEGLWFTYLCVVKKYKEKLRKCIKEKEKVEFERRDYCYKEKESHINRKQNQGFKYYDFKWKDTNTNKLTSIKNPISLNSNVRLLYGEAGSGKSVALSELFCAAAEDHIKDSTAPVPVFIELKELNRNNQKKIIDELLEVLKCTESEREQLLGHGKIMLFLDGVNEIMEFGGQVAIKCQGYYRSQIADIMNFYPKTKMWLSDREITNWGNAIRETQAVSKMELQKIQREDIRQFYKHKYPDSHLMDNMDLSVEIPDFMVEFVNTPLKLHMFCDFVYTNKEMPQDEMLLVEAYLRLLIEREYSEKLTLNLKSADIFWEILAKLSYEAGCENDPININTAKHVIRGVLVMWGNDIGETDNCIKIASELKIIKKEGDIITFPYVVYHAYLYDRYEELYLE